MKYQKIQIQLPTDYSEEQLLKKIKQQVRTSEFEYTIDKKSLDARNKRRIHWLITVLVKSDAIKDGDEYYEEELQIPKLNTQKSVLVVGSGPAGFFSAYALQKAGFAVTLIEQGKKVRDRHKDILDFENTGNLVESSNYGFGEGGAGTFSDGKLTSRTKSISLEKQFIFDEYVKAGAPEEIKYLAHPHIGSDILRPVVTNLRKKFEDLGGKYLFSTKLLDITKSGREISIADTSAGKIEADYFVIAPGHSSYETYKMLIKNGVLFRTKGFAIGSRAEHRQEVINQAQWGIKQLKGMKAAEYRLASKNKQGSAFTFCMCPGGMVVPAATHAGMNIVNGMSNYKRNSPYANAAVVASINFNEIEGREVEALEALDMLAKLENSFFEFTNNYSAPAILISDFIRAKSSGRLNDSSYPLGLKSAPLHEMLPKNVVENMRLGLLDFSRKMRGYEEGMLLGLESKTSSPIQVIKDDAGNVAGIDNLFICGEGSGYAGGIMSSAADGIKTAMKIIQKI